MQCCAMRCDAGSFALLARWCKVGRARLPSLPGCVCVWVCGLLVTAGFHPFWGGWRMRCSSAPTCTLTSSCRSPNGCVCCVLCAVCCGVFVVLSSRM
ncbi:hypothetical protein QBC46DRAFT_373279 [Diplogelasinospora grovesii]|uniref:Uncharacterized protein n=1 Tax=Diplogelasinospora grovesii TaxID=303347 RepID=A0AAN6S9I9_9PEZI|nr:hypothetical protein QBC46DRAFT_373279 [Diplogelasinospora grovesii]